MMGRSKKDDLSLALGLISVLGWGVAEVPQIITNFKTKSAEGLSIVFLVTWILGDLLNLFGCLLEPATLPTQYYTAMLYLVTTLILSVQSLYYSHIYPGMKSPDGPHLQEALQDDAARRMTDHNNPINALGCKFTPALPIPISHSPSPTTPRDIYLMSARSLSVSNTPPMGTFLMSRTPPPSDVEQNSLARPLLDDVHTTTSTSPLKVKAMLCVVGTMLFVGISQKNPVESHKNNLILTTPTSDVLLHGGRQLLLETIGTAGSSSQDIKAAYKSSLGSILGWGMAFIYLGGRLPQICLNIKRGNTKGLNPLMFAFALVANSTYVASILLKSTEWSKIQPNLPWLVDSGGCVFLDTFILMQFFYYRWQSRNKRDDYVS